MQLDITEQHVELLLDPADPADQPVLDEMGRVVHDLGWCCAAPVIECRPDGVIAIVGEVKDGVSEETVHALVDGVVEDASIGAFVFNVGF